MTIAVAWDLKQHTTPKKSHLPALALTTVLLKGSAKLGVLPSSILLVLKKRKENESIAYSVAELIIVPVKQKFSS